MSGTGPHQGDPHRPATGPASESEGSGPGRAEDRPADATPLVAQEESRPDQHDPLRGSRTSGLWAAVIALLVLLVLLAVFVFQNTQEVRVTYFGWEVVAPLSAALLVATAAGGLIVVAAGSLRILQLRRRVRRESRVNRGSTGR